MGVDPKNLEALEVAIGNYSEAIKNRWLKSGAKAQKATHADKLGDYTEDQLVDALVATFDPHITNKDNPHNDTAALLDTYTRTEADDRIGGGIPSFFLPYCRAGFTPYLPVDANITFGGHATRRSRTGIHNSFIYPMIEDDGTVVWLRNGTDGERSRVYYGYGIDAIGAFTRFYNTCHEYTLPDGKEVAYLYQGGYGVLAGRLADTSGNNKHDSQTVFIAEHNDTLESSKHRYVTLDPAYADVLNRSECLLAGDYVYIIEQTASVFTANNEAPAFKYHRFPISAFNLGGQVTPEKISLVNQSGIDGNNLAGTSDFFKPFVSFGATEESDTTAMFYSANDNDMFPYLIGGRPVTFSGYDESDGCIHTAYVYNLHSLVDGEHAYAVLHFRHNVNDASTITTQKTPTDFDKFVEGNGLYIEETSTTFMDEQACAFFHGRDDMFFATRVPQNIDEELTITRCKVDADSSIATMAKNFPACIKSKDVGELEIFPTGGIDTSSAALFPITTKYTLTNTKTISDDRGFARLMFDVFNGSSSPLRMVSTDGDVKNAYKAREIGTRVSDINAAITSTDLGGLMSLLDSATVTTWGSYFIKGGVSSRYQNITGTGLTLANKVTLAADAFDTAVRGYMQKANIDIRDHFHYECVVSGSTALPSIVLVFTSNDDGSDNRMVLFKVDPTISSGIVTLSEDYTLLGVLTNVDVPTDLAEVVGHDSDPLLAKLAVHKLDTGYAAVWTTGFTLNTSEYQHPVQLRFWINDVSSIEGIAYQFCDDLSNPGPLWGVLGYHGAGVFSRDIHFSSLSYRTVAKTKAEFLSWDKNQGEVIVATLRPYAAGGYYLNNKQPIILYGTLYDLTPLQVDTYSVGTGMGVHFTCHLVKHTVPDRQMGFASAYSIRTPDSIRVSSSEDSYYTFAILLNVGGNPTVGNRHSSAFYTQLQIFEADTGSIATVSLTDPLTASTTNWTR